MPEYRGGMVNDSYQPGAIEHMLNLDPATGRTRYTPGSVEHTRIAALLPENDRYATAGQRAEARAARLAAEEATVKTAVETGQLPAGWTPVRHATDPGASMSIGHAVGGGVYLVPEVMVETAKSAGFHPCSWPA